MGALAPGAVGNALYAVRLGVEVRADQVSAVRDFDTQRDGDGGPRPLWAELILAGLRERLAELTMQDVMRKVKC